MPAIERKCFDCKQTTSHGLVLRVYASQWNWACTAFEHVETKTDEVVFLRRSWLSFIVGVRSELVRSYDRPPASPSGAIFIMQIGQARTTQQLHSPKAWKRNKPLQPPPPNVWPWSAYRQAWQERVQRTNQKEELLAAAWGPRYLEDVQATFSTCSTGKKKLTNSNCVLLFPRSFYPPNSLNPIFFSNLWKFVLELNQAVPGHQANESPVR